MSKLIKERDKRCQFCGRTEGSLQKSHFWGRGHKSTRFDPENCDLLCFQCHMNHEGNKQGFYREWKIKQLGEEGYVALEQRHNKFAKYGAYEKPLIKKQLKEHGLDGMTQWLKDFYML